MLSRAPFARWFRIVVLPALLLGLLASCSPIGGDDDEEPTATPAISAGTDEVELGTSVATPQATPRSQASAGTPRAARAVTPTVEAGDAGGADDVDASPTASRSETAVDADEAGAGASPRATEDAAAEADEPEPTTVVVADCTEPDVLPERTGRQNRIVAEDGLNLRDGPGATCTVITSLTIATPVRVISGVVESENDDNDWVKVDVEGTEGWVAAEFLENPPAD